MSKKSKPLIDFNSLKKHENIKPFLYFSPLELDSTAGTYPYLIQLVPSQLEEMTMKGRSKGRLVREYACKVLQDLRTIKECEWICDNSTWLIDFDQFTENQLIDLKDKGTDVFTIPLYLVHIRQKKGQEGYKSVYMLYTEEQYKGIKPGIQKEPLKPNPPAPTIEPKEATPMPISKPMKSGSVEIDNGQFTYPNNEPEVLEAVQEDKPMPIIDRTIHETIMNKAKNIAAYMKKNGDNAFDLDEVKNSTSKNIGNLLCKMIYAISQSIKETDFIVEADTPLTFTELFKEQGEFATVVYNAAVNEYQEAKKVKIDRTELQAAQLMDLYTFTQQKEK